MGVAVVVRDNELGLSVVPIFQLGNRVTEVQQARSLRLEVIGSPVESYALVILLLDRRTIPLIEPERHPLVINHASDEATILPHGTIHGQPKPIHPEVETLLQVGTWYHRNTRINGHLRLRANRLTQNRRFENFV
jgi:hypothetical protein